MAVCPTCNASIDSQYNMNFCSECGSSLKAKQQSNLIRTAPSIKSLIGSTDVESFQNLTNQLRDLDTVDHEMDMAKTHYNGILREKNLLESELQQNIQIMEKEFRDVEKLQKKSWTSFMANVKGDKEAKLEIEEQEYLVAVQKKEATEDNLDKMSKELQQARVELNTVEQLVKRKQELTTEIHTLVNRVMEGVAHPEEDRIEDKLKDAKSRVTPLQNEISNIENAYNSISRAYSDFLSADRILGDAMGLANYDTFFGGGMFMDSMKHSRFREARNYVHSANRNLQAAYRYYPDLPVVQGLYVDEGGGEFFDVFFDNIFSDMAMRRRIGETRDRVRMKLGQVSNFKMQIQTLLQNKKRAYQELTSTINLLNDELFKIRVQILEEVANSSMKKTK